MTPTPKLRFFERVVPAPEYGSDVGKTVRTLQQWWEGEKWNADFTQLLGGEWRDVLIERSDK